MINNSYNILIVEDEWINAEFVSQVLVSLSQNIVGVATNAKDALKVIEKNSIDFIFMDINIEGATDGIQLAKAIKLKHSIPIIYMTAFGDSQTITETSSTDIYGFIIKPFHAQDVEAALNVAIQRAKIQTAPKEIINQDTIELGKSYSYHSKDMSLIYKQSQITLTKKESQLLDILCLNLNALVSTDAIYTHVWENKSVSDSTMRDTIARLRKKILPLELKNVVGMGYILKKA